MAVMTSNVTRFTVNISAVLFARESCDVVTALARARYTWPTIVGFASGCAEGAVCERALGLRSLVLPAGFAFLLALALTLRFDVGKAIDDEAP